MFVWLFCFLLLLCLHGCDGMVKMLSIFPGVVSQLCEGLFLPGGWWKYQQSAVPAPHPPDHQHLPDHPAPQPQSQTWYCCCLILHTSHKRHKRSETGKHLRIWQIQPFAQTFWIWTSASQDLSLPYFNFLLHLCTIASPQLFVAHNIAPLLWQCSISDHFKHSCHFSGHLFIWVLKL